MNEHIAFTPGDRVVFVADDRPESHEFHGWPAVVTLAADNGRCVVQFDSGKRLGCGIESLRPMLKLEGVLEALAGLSGRMVEAAVTLPGARRAVAMFAGDFDEARRLDARGDETWWLRWKPDGKSKPNDGTVIVGADEFVGAYIESSGSEDLEDLFSDPSEREEPSGAVWSVVIFLRGGADIRLDAYLPAP